MMRYPEQCGNKWRMGRQTKPGWQKQKEKEEKREEFRRSTIEEEIVIARIVEEKEKERNEEKDLIELRIVEEMVLRRFHKYLKMFKKKESERMLTRKTRNHAIDLREGFMLKKGKIYPLLKVEREEVQKFVKDQLKKRYISHHRQHQYSLCKKKMERREWYKTIDT